MCKKENLKKGKGYLYQVLGILLLPIVLLLGDFGTLICLLFAVGTAISEIQMKKYNNLTKDQLAKIYFTTFLNYGCTEMLTMVGLPVPLELRLIIFVGLTIFKQVFEAKCNNQTISKETKSWMRWMVIALVIVCLFMSANVVSGSMSEIINGLSKENPFKKHLMKSIFTGLPAALLNGALALFITEQDKKHYFVNDAWEKTIDYALGKPRKNLKTIYKNLTE